MTSVLIRKPLPAVLFEIRAYSTSNPAHWPHGVALGHIGVPGSGIGYIEAQAVPAYGFMEAGTSGDRPMDRGHLVWVADSQVES